MRIIPPALRRKIPVADLDEKGEAISARLVEEDTWEVILFQIDSVNNRCNGLIARGFVNVDGQFEFQPGNYQNYEIHNENHPSGPVPLFADFVARYGGDPSKICGDNFLEELIYLGRLPSVPPPALQETSL